MKIIFRKENVPLLIFILFFGILRYCMWIVFPTVHTYPDSVGYAGMGSKIISDFSLQSVINPFRMPVYPILLGLSDAFFPYAAYLPVVAFQIVSSGAAFLFAYKTLRTIGINKVPSALAIGMLTLHPTLAANDWTLLTESLTTSSVTIAFCAFLRFLHTGNLRWTVITTLGTLLSIGLRPSSVVIPGIFLFVYLIRIALKRISWKRILLNTCILAIPLIATIVYAFGNYSIHGYFGLQYVGDINLLGKIMQYDIPLSQTGNEGLANALSAYSSQTKNGNVYRFLDYIGFNYTNSQSMEVLSTVIKTTLSRYPLQFLLHTVYLYPTTILDSDTPTFPNSHLEEIRTILFTLFRIEKLMHILWLLIPFGLVYAIGVLAKNPHSIRTWMMFMGFFLIIVYTMQNAALGYEAYHRLNTPMTIITVLSYVGIPFKHTGSKS